MPDAAINPSQSIEERSILAQWNSRNAADTTVCIDCHRDTGPGVFAVMRPRIAGSGSIRASSSSSSAPY